jgi:hypothetical protein
MTTTTAAATLSTAYGHRRAGEEPFVVLTGARGLGKSAVLRELWAAYRGRTPVALIDGEETQFRRPPRARPAEAWSPTYQALLAVAEQLAEPVGNVGRIPFPRLACGLLAVAAGGWGSRDLPGVREETERILALSDTGSWPTTGRWAGKVAARLTASMSGVGPLADPQVVEPEVVDRVVIEPIIEAALEAFTEGMSSAHRRLRKGAVWYGRHPRTGGSPKRGLVLLAGHFRADGGAPRTYAERQLVRALLADLDDAYAGVVRRAHRAGRPVNLVDNLQEDAGRRLMECVLRDRADGIPDRVSFFAALRGDAHPALRNAERRTLPEVIRDIPWTPGSTPSSRALLVPLALPLPRPRTPMVSAPPCPRSPAR